MPDLEASRSEPQHGNGPHHGYDANQPRVPSGHSDGGQWTKTPAAALPRSRAARRSSTTASRKAGAPRQTLAVDNTQLLALRHFRSMFHSMNMLSLTATQGGQAIRGRHRTVDGHRPEQRKLSGPPRVW